MTILADKAYEEADLRSARWAEQQVKRRFVEVYGKEKGEEFLSSIRERMDQNIRSDSRSEEKPVEDTKPNTP